MIFVITDTHLGHENIKRYCNRPDDFESLIECRWKASVTDDDTMIHLGDVSFDKKLVQKLGSWPGRKILLRGNHDERSDSFYMSAGFSLVAETLTLRIQGIRLLFSHRPQFGHDADINIHGHQHNLSVLDPTRLYLPLSIEHMGYAPLALDDRFMARVKPWVEKKRQPNTEELMRLFQNAIGQISPKDCYDGFGETAQNTSRDRLMECYAVFQQPLYVASMRKNRLWDIGRRYIEGRIEQEEFLKTIKGFAMK